MIFNSTNRPLSGKQKSNMQLGRSHSWHGAFLCLLVSTIVCFVVCSPTRPILNVDFKAIADSTELLRVWGVTKALFFPFKAWTLQSPIPPATSFSLPFLYLSVHLRYYSSHSLIALLLLPSFLHVFRGRNNKETKRKSVLTFTSSTLHCNSNTEAQFQGKWHPPLKQAQLL